MDKNEANMIEELLIEQADKHESIDVRMFNDRIEFRHESAVVAYNVLDTHLAYVGPRTSANPVKLPHFQYADPNFAENVLKHAKSELISSLCTSVIDHLQRENHADLSQEYYGIMKKLLERHSTKWAESAAKRIENSKFWSQHASRAHYLL
jgi:hypothetical protein